MTTADAAREIVDFLDLGDQLEEAAPGFARALRRAAADLALSAGLHPDQLPITMLRAEGVADLEDILARLTILGPGDVIFAAVIRTALDRERRRLDAAEGGLLDSEGPSP